MITNLADQLRRDEAEKQFAYDDADGSTLLKGSVLKGNLSIGVGRNLSAKGISKKEQDFLLANDIDEATVALEANFPWTTSLEPIRKGALLNLTFNMGIHDLTKFQTFMGLMEQGQYAEAAADLRTTAIDHEEPARIGRLALQLESGNWQ